MRLRHEWNAIIGCCMCVRAKKHCECWACATLPLAPSATHHLPDGIATARDFQTQLFGDATAHDHGSVDAQLRHREIMLADIAARIVGFLRAVVQRNITLFGLPVGMVLHTTEDVLSIA